MTPEQVISDLLYQDNATHPNLVLFKKFLLCVHLGWFRINGESPDETYTLGDYIFDDEKIVFDYTKLNEYNKQRFLNWFLAPHNQDADRALLNGIVTDDYRGYTAEVGLSWWGRITNLLYYQKKSYHWSLAPFSLSLNYQLTGIQVCQGEYGLLMGLNQFATREMQGRYHAENPLKARPLLNVKRLILTNALVDELLQTDVLTQDYEEIIATPHPYAIPVTNYEERLQKMTEYRQTQRFAVAQAWYVKLWQRFKSALKNLIYHTAVDKPKKSYQLLLKEDDALVLQCQNTGGIQFIQERKLNSIVFSGGGAKIFGHIGVLRALEEAGISLKRYAGSSAGAVMAMLAYLGYSHQEIFAFFKEFRQENLIHYEIDRTGLSDTKAIKAALDFMIIQKVNQIIERYHINETPTGRRFIAEVIMANNKITFSSLHALQKAYPDCGIGDELVITATNIKQGKTRYFSHLKTPDKEVSEIVTTSASFPIFFKPTLLDGEAHNDGGVLSNFPTEAFADDDSVLLTSEHNNCLSMLGVQFDNGHERSLLDKLVDRVYRENPLLNLIYSYLTGVHDTVAGWEKDRLKLLQHSNQVILIPVGKVTATQFNIDPETQDALIESGYKETNNYIASRYQMADEEEGAAVNEEYLYANFTHLEEALYYACYRKNEKWFELFANEAIAQGLCERKVQKLRERHFPLQEEKELADEGLVAEENNELYTRQLGYYVEKKMLLDNHAIFSAVYPIFLRLPSQLLFKNKIDLKIYKKARHDLASNQPHTCFALLQKTKGASHILFAILKQWILTSDEVDLLCQRAKLFNRFLSRKIKLVDEAFYGNWDNVLPRQLERVFKALLHEQYNDAKNLCLCFKAGEEPLYSMCRNEEAVIEEEQESSYNESPVFT